MIEHLDSLEQKYEKISSLLSNPSNSVDYISLSKEFSNLEPVVKKYRELKEIRKKISEAKEILRDSKDEELKILAEEELKELDKKEERLLNEIKLLLVPKDPNDEKDIFLEIRAGTGGQEATLFAQDLYRMYYRFAERKGWKVEIMDQSVSDIGGFKEIIMSVKGKRVWSYLKWESGVHRVQRVPKTESSGRIHTSTATVAVLPEVDEVEIHIEPKDLKIEAFGASGPGGQNVNRNYTAIRVTHIPTGIVVSCQDEKSQHRNKEKAFRILRARLYEMALKEQMEKISEDRRKQVGTGERAEKIRTYNFIQGRVTDHRINLTLYKLEAILDGELDELIDALSTYYNSKALEESLKIPA
jgi:peptide chain release factor 1